VRRGVIAGVDVACVAVGNWVVIGVESRILVFRKMDRWSARPSSIEFLLPQT
jgi:hypothetical protein